MFLFSTSMRVEEFVVLWRKICFAVFLVSIFAFRVYWKAVDSGNRVLESLSSFFSKFPEFLRNFGAVSGCGGLGLRCKAPITVAGFLIAEWKLG